MMGNKSGRASRVDECRNLETGTALRRLRTDPFPALSLISTVARFGGLTNGHGPTQESGTHRGTYRGGFHTGSPSVHRNAHSRVHHGRAASDRHSSRHTPTAR